VADWLTAKVLPIWWIDHEPSFGTRRGVYCNYRYFILRFLYIPNTRIAHMQSFCSFILHSCDTFYSSSSYWSMGFGDGIESKDFTFET
jgi:hypothetical protein